MPQCGARPPHYLNNEANSARRINPTTEGGDSFAVKWKIGNKRDPAVTQLVWLGSNEG